MDECRTAAGAAEASGDGGVLFRGGVDDYRPEDPAVSPEGQPAASRPLRDCDGFRRALGRADLSRVLGALCRAYTLATGAEAVPPAGGLLAGLRRPRRCVFLKPGERAADAVGGGAHPASALLRAPSPAARAAAEAFFARGAPPRNQPGRCWFPTLQAAQAVCDHFGDRCCAVQQHDPGRGYEPRGSLWGSSADKVRCALEKEEKRRASPQTAAAAKEGGAYVRRQCAAPVMMASAADAAAAGSSEDVRAAASSFFASDHDGGPAISGGKTGTTTRKSRLIGGLLSVLLAAGRCVSRGSAARAACLRRACARGEGRRRARGRGKAQRRTR